MCFLAALVLTKGSCTLEPGVTALCFSLHGRSYASLQGLTLLLLARSLLTTRDFLDAACLTVVGLGLVAPHR